MIFGRAYAHGNSFKSPFEFLQGTEGVKRIEYCLRTMSRQKRFNEHSRDQEFQNDVLELLITGMLKEPQKPYRLGPVELLSDGWRHNVR